MSQIMLGDRDWSYMGRPNSQLMNLFLLQDLKVMHLVGPSRPEVKRRVARQCSNLEWNLWQVSVEWQ